MAPRDWQKRGSKTVFKTSIFELREELVVNPRNGSELNTYILECPDWINVIALTPSDEIVLVRQFRHGVGKVTLEIPGGVIDAGEDPIEAARRELLEETGFRAESIVHIGTADSQPAYQNNLCHTFLALNATRVAEPTPDEGEDLDVTLVECGKIHELILSGEIRHGLIIAAFHWLHLWKSSQNYCP